MKVILEKSLSLRGAALYTVHDNFITNARISKEVPQAYINAFTSMDSPLLLINRVLNDNIIKRWSRWNNPWPKDLIVFAFELNNELKKGCTGCNDGCEKCMEYHYINESSPIPPNLLSKFFYQSIIPHVPKSSRKPWNKRIENLLLCYSEFVKRICAVPKDLGEQLLSEESELLDAQELNLMRFLAKVRTMKEGSYCVHH